MDERARLVALVALAGVAFFLWKKTSSAPASTTLPTQSLNPDYGTGWPGQGSLGPPPPAPLGKVAKSSASPVAPTV